MLGNCVEQIGSLWLVPLLELAGVAWHFCPQVSPAQLWSGEAAQACGCRGSLWGPPQ